MNNILLIGISTFDVGEDLTWNTRSPTIDNVERHKMLPSNTLVCSGGYGGDENLQHLLFECAILEIF
jgi:hypothetical protein